MQTILFAPLVRFYPNNHRPANTRKNHPECTKPAHGRLCLGKIARINGLSEAAVHKDSKRIFTSRLKAELFMIAKEVDGDHFILLSKTDSSFLLGANIAVFIAGLNSES